MCVHIYIYIYIYTHVYTYVWVIVILAVTIVPFVMIKHTTNCYYRSTAIALLYCCYYTYCTYHIIVAAITLTPVTGVSEKTLLGQIIIFR